DLTPEMVPAGRALLRRLSGATARGLHPRLVALAASPPASPVAPGRTRQARFYPASSALLTRGEKLARLRGRKETAARSVPGAGGIDIDSSVGDPDWVEPVAGVEGHLVDRPFVVLRRRSGDLELPYGDG